MTEGVNGTGDGDRRFRSMKTSANMIDSAKCRDLAAAMREDATRATLWGFSERLIRGAEDLERHAAMLTAAHANVIQLPL
jgi:hypothetical protein